MKATQIVFVTVNVIGMAIPMIFPHHSGATINFYFPLISWPIFIFCIWGGWRGKVRYEDDHGQVWHLNLQINPKEFWWAMSCTCMAGWLLMLAMRAGERV